jgi:WD40 repeat protein
MRRSRRSAFRSGKSVAVTMGAVIALLFATEGPAAAALPQGSPTQSGGVNGQVYATLVVGHTVYVGGGFSQAQVRGGASTNRTNLAAFNLDTGALLGSWRADVNGTVTSLATSGNFLYVGGGYTRIGGVAQARLARVSLTTGAVDTGFRPQLNSQVRAVQVGNGAAYAGGQFTTSGGTSQAYLAKFDATTGVMNGAFTATTDGPVYALALSPDGTRLAVAGRLNHLGSASRTGLGLVSSTTGAVVGPAFQSSIRPMLSLDWSDDGNALFGGSANSNNRVARWNPTTGARSWNFSAGGDIQAVAFFDGDVYVGFHDGFQGNTRTKLVAVDAQSGAISTAFRPTFNQFWGVRSISAGPWGLIIGGQFTTVSGTWAHNWARWSA